jgi:hypothetical protein
MGQIPVKQDNENRADRLSYPLCNESREESMSPPPLEKTKSKQSKIEADPYGREKIEEMLSLIQADQVWEDAEGKARPVKHKDPKNEFRKDGAERRIGDKELSQKVRTKKSYSCDQGSLGQLKAKGACNHSPIIGWSAVALSHQSQRSATDSQIDQLHIAGGLEGEKPEPQDPKGEVSKGERNKEEAVSDDAQHRAVSGKQSQSEALMAKAWHRFTLEAKRWRDAEKAVIGPHETESIDLKTLWAANPKHEGPQQQSPQYEP